MKFLFLLGVLLLGIVGPSFGQTVSATTGAINGRVADNTGGVLPGVTVTITSTAMMGTRTALTNEEGFYRFPGVPPGDYKIAFEIAGFTTVYREDIRVGLGFTATVNAEMGVASLNENVTVTGESPVVDTQATKVTQSFSAEQLNSLPGTREFWSLLSVTPAVQMSAIDVGGSQAALSTGFTAYGMNTQHRQMVEGIVVIWGASSFYYADMGAFAEAAISPVGNNAEAPLPGVQSSFISKSGGNQYRGSLYFGYQNGDVQSHNIDADQIARGVTGGGGVDAVDTNRLLRYRDFTADIGGYLKKDRLWWYYAYRNNKAAVRLPNLLETEQTRSAPNHSVKITYNATDDIHLSGYLQRANKLQLPYLTSFRVASGSAIYMPNSAWLDQYPAGVYKGEYSQSLGNNMFVEARAGNHFAYWTNWAMTQTELRYEDIGNNVVSGGNRGYKDIRDRPQVLGSLSYFKDDWFGTHNFRFGGELLREVTTLTDGGFPQNVLHVLRNGAPTQAYVFESPNSTESGLWTRSAYFTDTWRVTKRMTLDLGARFDRYQPFLPAQQHQAGPNNPTAIDFPSVDRLITWNNFAPRIGAIYDFSGEGRTALKFSYGTSWWNPASDFAAQLNPNQEFWYNLYAWSDPNGDRVFQLGERGLLQGTSGGVASRVIDPNLENQYTREVVTMLEHELAPNFGVRSGFVWLGNRNLRAQVNLNQPYSAFNVPTTIQDPGPDGTPGTSDDGGSIPAWNLASQYLGLPTRNLTQELPDATDNFYTWEVTGDKRMSGRWSLLATFAKTWHRRSVLPTNPNMIINTVDGQNHSTTWQAKVTSTMSLPGDFRVTPLLRHQSGNSFGRTFVATGLNYGSPSVLAEAFNSQRTRNVTIFDVHVEKAVRVYERRLAGFFDVYNIFNANPEINVSTSSGGTWLRPTGIVAPRIARVGLRLDW